MTELKTRPNDQNVEEFLNKVENETKRKDSFKILEIMKELTKEELSNLLESLTIPANDNVEENIKELEQLIKEERAAPYEIFENLVFYQDTVLEIARNNGTCRREETNSKYLDDTELEISETRIIKK